MMQGRRKLPRGGAADRSQSVGAPEGSEIEARRGDHSARSAEKIFSPSFSVIRRGSRGIFVL